MTLPVRLRSRVARMKRSDGPSRLHYFTAIRKVVAAPRNSGGMQAVWGRHCKLPNRRWRQAGIGWEPFDSWRRDQNQRCDVGGRSAQPRPITDPRGIPLVYLADTSNTPATHSLRNLDPTAFIDDSGQAYRMTHRSLGSAKITNITTSTNRCPAKV
jgi:hypothetical protein